MDRRIKKTRKAVFSAFLSLLAEKSADRITVDDIVLRADIGRTTFYDNFESKELLWTELVNELFCHLFDSENGDSSHGHIFDCENPAPPFLHLLIHIKNNDNRIADLIVKQQNGIFADYFKKSVRGLVKSRTSGFVTDKCRHIPVELLERTVTSVFCETVLWWLTENKCALSPEAVEGYFKSLTGAAVAAVPSNV